MNAILTNHAKDRLKERHGVKNKKKAEHLCKNAFERGVKIDQTKGALNDWLSRKTRPGFYISCYQDLAFVFSNANECITVLQIPPAINKNIKNLILPA